MPKAMDISGRTFERLTVLYRDTSCRPGRSVWVCECACGAVVSVAGKSLVSGNTKSCGCLQRESRVTNGERKKHGRGSNKPGHRDATYISWFSMKSRCDRVTDKEYHRYGANGVRYCRRWKEFENFLIDMGERPKGKTLDRINPDGNYTPDNCRWASRAEQGQNLRTTRKFAYGGEMLSLTEMSNLFGMSREKLKYRLCEKGLSVEDAIRSING